MDEPDSYAKDGWILLLNVFQLFLLYLPMIVMLVYLGRRACVYVRHKKSAEVDSVLAYDSDVGGQFISKTTEKGVSSRRTDYGSIEERY